MDNLKWHTFKFSTKLTSVTSNNKDIKISEEKKHLDETCNSVKKQWKGNSLKGHELKQRIVFHIFSSFSQV